MLLPQMILKNCDLEASNAIYSLLLFYMSFLCLSYVNHMYSYVTRMSFVWSRISSVCHSYVLVVTRMSLVCTLMSPVYHSYVVLCYPYVTRMNSYVIYMSLVYTLMSSDVTRLWFYHEPLFSLVCQFFTLARDYGKNNQKLHFDGKLITQD